MTRTILGTITAAFLVCTLALPAMALNSSPSPSAAKGSITLHKTGVNDGDLAGADFSVYLDDADNTFESESDTFIANGTTDTTGMLVFSGLDLGSYWVVETNVPGDYQLADPVEVTLPDAAGDTSVELEVSDQIKGAATPHPSRTPKKVPSTPTDPFGEGVNLPGGLLILGSSLLLLAGLAWLIVPHRRRASRPKD